jgi:hypothetical protein
MDGQSLGAIACRFRQLAELGLFKERERIRRRGPIEHVYRRAGAAGGHQVTWPLVSSAQDSASAQTRLIAASSRERSCAFSR